MSVDEGSAGSHASARSRPLRRTLRTHGRRPAALPPRRLEGRPRRPRRPRRPLALALRQRAPPHDAGHRARLAGHGAGCVPLGRLARSAAAAAARARSGRSSASGRSPSSSSSRCRQASTAGSRPAPPPSGTPTCRPRPPSSAPARTPSRSTPRPPAAGWPSPRASSPWRWPPRPPSASGVSCSAPSIAIVAGAVLVAVYGFVARLVFGDKLFGVWTVPDRRPLRPLRQQEPLRRLRRARGAPRGGPGGGPRRRGAPRRGLAELDRQPPREVGRRRVGRGPRARAGGAGLALARRRRQPDRGLLAFVVLLRSGPARARGSRPAASLAALAGLVAAAGRAARRGPAHGGARPRPHPRRHHDRPVRLRTAWPSGATRCASPPRARGRLRLRRLRGRAAPLQDRGRRLPRPARRERPPGAPGRRRPRRRRPGSPALVASVLVRGPSRERAGTLG